MEDVDVKVLHWMCVSRGLDVGGSNQQMLIRLHQWQGDMDDVGVAEAEGLLQQREEELNQRYGPPPGYDEHVDDAVASRRCMMMPVAADVEDAALALVVLAKAALADVPGAGFLLRAACA